MNDFIISLSFADLLIGIMSLVLYVAVQSLDPISCITRFVVIAFNLMSSVTSLLLVTVDRYVAITYPMFYYARGGLPCSTGLIFISWLFAAIASIILFFWRKPFTVCDFVSLVMPAYYIIFYICVVYSCALIMIALYSRLFIVAAGQELRMIQENSATVQSNSARIKRDRK